MTPDTPPNAGRGGSVWLWLLLFLGLAVVIALIALAVEYSWPRIPIVAVDLERGEEFLQNKVARLDRQIESLQQQKLRVHAAREDVQRDARVNPEAKARVVIYDEVLDSIEERLLDLRQDRTYYHAAWLRAKDLADD
jgi:hypothetical protein